MPEPFTEVGKMERHLSTGVSTLVALMAAHRAIAERPPHRPPVLDQNEIAGIETMLRGKAEPLQHHTS
jgi:hypothetical protein